MIAPDHKTGFGLMLAFFFYTGAEELSTWVTTVSQWLERKSSYACFERNL